MTPLRLLVLTSGFWSLALALSEPFINAYLWSLGQGFASIGLFNLILFASMTAAFWFGGPITASKGPQIPFRWGLLLIAFFLGAVLSLGQSAAFIALILAIFLGFGYGFYWLAFYVLAYDISLPAQRDWLNGITGSLEQLAYLIGPMLAALFIGLFSSQTTGFRSIFGVSTVLLLITFAMTYLLPNRHADFTKHHTARPQWPGYGPSPWIGILKTHMFLSFREGVYIFAPSLILYILSGSALNLGAFASSMALVSTVGFYFMGRLGHPGNRRSMLRIGTGLSVIAGILLYWGGLNIIAIWVFGLVQAAAIPLLKVPVEACTLDVISSMERTVDDRVKCTVVKEVAINGMRALSVAVAVIFLSIWNEAETLRWLLIILSLMPIMALLSMQSFNIAQVRAYRP